MTTDLEPQSEANVYAPPRTSAERLVPEAVEPVFFPCGTLKLGVMIFCTLGLYQFYWFYRNWKCAGRLLGESYWTVVRAVFFPLTAYSLFQKIEFKGLQQDVRMSGSAGVLGITVFLLNAASRLPDPWWMVSFLGFLPILAVQDTVNGINGKLAPDVDPNTRFSVGNILGAVLGGLVLVLAVVGMFVQPPPR